MGRANWASGWSRFRNPKTTTELSVWQRTSNVIFGVGIALIILLTLAGAAGAQDLSLTLGEDGSLTARSIQLLILLTVLSLVPALAVMFTCFPFMVTVLSILRQGIGLQQSPPNMLIVSLALFLTYFVMEPVFFSRLERWDFSTRRRRTVSRGGRVSYHCTLQNFYDGPGSQRHHGNFGSLETGNRRGDGRVGSTVAAGSVVSLK